MPITVNSIPIWVPPSLPPPGEAPEISGPPALPSAAAPPRLLLSVPFFEQEEDNWCWAACTQMIMAFFELDFDQCAIAQLLFTERDCCDDRASCDEGCDPEDVKEVLRDDQLQVECRRFSRPLTFETIKKELREGRPVLAAILWFSHAGDPRGGHVIVIKGCHTENNRRYVKINDPYYGRVEVPFPKLQTYYGPEDDDQDGVWDQTWIKIAR